MRLLVIMMKTEAIPTHPVQHSIDVSRSIKWPSKKHDAQHSEAVGAAIITSNS